MKKTAPTSHPISGLFSLLLFGLFVLFLLIMLLFSAQIYQQSIKKADSETDLGTVSSYIATKFRQHDVQDGIFTDELNDIPALCFRDTINNQDYITYLYLDDGRLKELFTADGSSAQANAGTAIASLSDFQIEENANGFYHVFLQSTAPYLQKMYTLQLHLFYYLNIYRSPSIIPLFSSNMFMYKIYSCRYPSL